MNARELTVEMENLKVRLELQGKAYEELKEEQRRLLQAMNDHRLASTQAVGEASKENIHFRRDLDDMKKWKDETKKEQEERTRRVWSFGPNLAASVVNVLLSALVAYLVSRR